jgi:hypothetical protein
MNLQEEFISGKIYRRSEIHDLYGGNRQSGISASAKAPFIFIFSGKTGKKHGYQDGWDNPNVFSYTGEGQKGNMEFTKGNLALREHLIQNRRVFLFEFVRKGEWMFQDEVEYLDFSYGEILDTDGELRQGIRFFFKRQGVFLPNMDIFDEELAVTEPEPQGYGLDVPNSTERLGLVTSRVGHGAYRKRLIHRWEYKCAVTGFNKPQILIASHILPWKDATNQERIDVNNGIILSPVYDALFDKHLISFEDSGKIILSDQFNSMDYQKIGVTGKEKILSFNADNLYYLRQHRDFL